MDDPIEQKVKHIICRFINISEWSLNDDFRIQDYSEDDIAFNRIAKAFDLDQQSLSEVPTLWQLIEYIRGAQSKVLDAMRANMRMTK